MIKSQQMAKVYKRPGVYIEEVSAFPSSVVPVATAVPAFIGYTEKAKGNNKSLHLQPTRISSYGEFLQYFGGAPKPKFELSDSTDPQQPFRLKLLPNTYFILHASLRLFFANGGSDCYIVSVGDYASTGVQYSDLESGIEPLVKEPEPTMLVIPEAILLQDKSECYDLQQAMLRHCGADTQRRFAILDVWVDQQQMLENPQWKTSLFTNDVDDFRTGIGQNYLEWGAAYFPYLHTTIIAGNEVNFANISDESLVVLVNLIKTEVDTSVAKGNLDAQRGAKIKAEADKLTADGADSETLHQTLLAVSPIYKFMMANVMERINVLPPSGAMAGIYSMVDNNTGVFKAPANVNVGSVAKLTVNINTSQQENLNAPLNGKAVNALRTFPGKGVLVWGARTLAGNNQDWRYVNVRRTMIFLEQSIKTGVQPFVFEPNDANTWIRVKSMIENFLINVWKQGGLAGAKPSDAFAVNIGLGSTMTSVDVLEGRMIVTVMVAMVRPAEFMVITFTQQMQQA